MFRKVLIANRGEIAVRAIRACRELGVGTVAVHSDVDTHAVFVELADEAIALGGRSPRESYLAQDKVLEAALRTGADGIHPGYGFLSENAAFARRVRDEGITFIGPSPEAMEAIGDKVKARALALKTGVPVSPGSPGRVDSEKKAAKIAEDIGYPVLLKAAAGGGGMGMQLVRSAAELPKAWTEASAQAESAFGDGTLFLEKFHERPRHIEIQLLGLEGGAIHLGERECSIQRRYQKLIEESPSPAVSEKLRAEIGAAAVRIADAVDYRNAGTAEFLLTDKGFYFNEVNARLQVEHPVTEMVTGVDLMKAQMRIASGEDPKLSQKGIQLRGHAIECRINAEDAVNNFVPSPGKLARYREPQGPFVRVDSGVREGGEIAREYDSLVAKLIVWGSTRDEARERCIAALRSFRIEGIETTIPLHVAILQEENFIKGRLSTRYLSEVKVLESVRALAHDARRERLARVAAVAAALNASRGLYAVARQRPLKKGELAAWLVRDDP